MNRESFNDTLLVPVDLSHASEGILLEGARFAQKFSVSLLILHVVHETTNGTRYPRTLRGCSVSTRLEDIAATMLHDLVGRLRERHAGLEPLQHARIEVVSGLPGNRICEVAARNKLSMIVMGDSGQRGFTRLLAGSTADQVRRAVDVPVTSIRAQSSTIAFEPTLARPLAGAEPPPSIPA